MLVSVVLLIGDRTNILTTHITTPSSIVIQAGQKFDIKNDAIWRIIARAQFLNAEMQIQCKVDAIYFHPLLMMGGWNLVCKETTFWHLKTAPWRTRNLNEKLANLKCLNLWQIFKMIQYPITDLIHLMTVVQMTNRSIFEGK